jgi:hypothetical protein
MKDGKNHVLKIVCGKGIHSHGRPVLKFKVPQLLVSNSLINITPVYSNQRTTIFTTSRLMAWFLSGL